MPKQTYIHQSFTGGEYSPLLEGNIQAPRRFNSLRTCQNLVPLRYGPVTRRPGSIFVNEVKNSSHKTLLIPFQYSRDDSYILEFGDDYIRFYRAGGQILAAPGVPYEIRTIYRESELFKEDGTPAIRVLQSLNYLYIFHPDIPPYRLIRIAHDNWTISEVQFVDGPYLNINTTPTTLTPTRLINQTGSAPFTFTASSLVGINNGQGFLSSDTGRLVRFSGLNSNSWAVLRILNATDNHNINVQVLAGTWDTLDASTTWRLGLVSAESGYPTNGTFFQDRLVLSGFKNFPETFTMSVSSDYENFQPSSLTDGQVNANHAIYRTLSSRQENSIHWMENAEQGLVVGTENNEWLVRASTRNEAINNANINASILSHIGSGDVDVLSAYNNLLYLNNVREKLYAIASEQSISKPIELSIFGEHLARSSEGRGFVAAVYQQEPYSVLWFIRSDGVLIGCTYDHPQEVIAWHRHNLNGEVESIAVVREGPVDQLWLTVKREINGVTKRYVERLADYFEDSTAQEDAMFYDSSLSYKGTAVTSVSGLDHLEGETVGVLINGAAHEDVEVLNGSIQLTESATTVQVGLKNQWVFETLPVEAGAADGTAQSKLKRIDALSVNLFRSLDISYGAKEDNVTLVPSLLGHPMGEAPGLVTGYDRVEVFGRDFDREGTVVLLGNGGFPVTIRAVVTQLVGQDEQ